MATETDVKIKNILKQKRDKKEFPKGYPLIVSDITAEDSHKRGRLSVAYAKQYLSTTQVSTRMNEAFLIMLERHKKSQAQLLAAASEL